MFHFSINGNSINNNHKLQSAAVVTAKNLQAPANHSFYTKRGLIGKYLTFPVIATILLSVQSHSTRAVEILSETELASHCQAYPKDNQSLDGEFCARYIQGFIDGAVATDARVMLNVEADNKQKSNFKERALRTRMPNRAEYQRAARYAEFCLGDPVPLKEVVLHVVDDLAQKQKLEVTRAARETVYVSLKRHYPCTTD